MSFLRYPKARFPRRYVPSFHRQTSTIHSRHTNPRPSPYHNHNQPSPPPSDTDIDVNIDTDTDSDTEYFPGNLSPATSSQINRFTELTSLPPKQAAKRLHQHRDMISGDILFNEALTAFFVGGHDHEDDEEYEYDEDGCFCLERAAERVLDEVVRRIREELGREQGEFEVVLDGVRGVLELGWEELGVPFVVWEAVRVRFDGIRRAGVGEVVSLHQESLVRVFKVDA